LLVAETSGNLTGLLLVTQAHVVKKVLRRSKPQKILLQFQALLGHQCTDHEQTLGCQVIFKIFNRLQN